MNKSLFFLGWWLLVSLSLCAQHVDHRNCGTQESDSLRRLQYPEVGSRTEFEAWIQRMSAQGRSSNTRGEILTLPLIVHIIHNGEAQGVGNNISYEQVTSQIEVLNEDFRRLPGTPGFNNNPAGADTEIEFCLATIDPAGVPMLEPGVNRIDRGLKGWNAPPYTMNYANSIIKPQTQWDPTQYLNVWVMPLSSGLLGFAQSPDASTLGDIPLVGGAASADGIVIRPISFGRVGNVSAPFHRGRTMTHEMGHFLGLLHPSGDGGCAVDDGCSDTPTTAAPNYGCTSGASSCGSVDMIENYLEYTNDECMNIFTLCQRDRMHTVLANSPRRGSLAQSTVCSQSVPPAVLYKASSRKLCAGEKVQFTDLSLYQPNTWSWTFPGGTPATSSLPNPLVEYAQPGIYAVTLTVSNAYGSTTRSDIDYLVVNASGQAGFFIEDFEGGVPATWEVDNPDQSFTWSARQVEGQPSGVLAAWVNCYQYPTVGQRDRLTSPLIDLRNYSNVQLSLDHAYRRYQGSNLSSDSLIIYASADSGKTFPFRLIALGESGAREFATAGDTTGLFIPKVASDWCFAGPSPNCIQLSLAQLEGKPGVRLRWETYNDYGNAIFIDNITLTGSCLVTSISDPVPPLQVEVFPNPVNAWVTIRLSELQSGMVNILLRDLQGRLLQDHREVRDAGSFEWDIDMECYPTGIYLIEVETREGRAWKRVLKE